MSGNVQSQARVQLLAKLLPGVPYGHVRDAGVQSIHAVALIIHSEPTSVSFFPPCLRGTPSGVNLVTSRGL